MGEEDKDPGFESEEDEDMPDAVYYYCPHCKMSHDMPGEGVKPGEAVCPICGEVYEEK